MSKRYALGGFESSDPEKMVDMLINQLKSTKPMGLPLDQVWEKLQARIRDFEKERSNAELADVPCFKCERIGKTCWPCLPFVIEEGCNVPEEKEEKEMEVRFDAKRHQLKTWTLFYQDIIEGKKMFELRKDDRDFQVGDILVLNEWNVAKEEYTRRSVSVKITYMFRGLENLGMLPGYCIMGIRRIR